jgi:hypothetical protein
VPLEQVSRDPTARSADKALELAASNGAKISVFGPRR